MPIAFIVAASLLGATPGPGAAAGTPAFTHDAYVWQRRWTAALKTSLPGRAAEFSRLIVLGAEIAMDAGRPRVVRTEADYRLLRDLGRPAGLALRVGPVAQPLEPTSPAARCIAETATALMESARLAGLEPAELQVDYDCATRRLAEYRVLLDSLRRRVRAPLTFTALPAWLESPAFPDLARASDGFVLQVHSLARPSGPDDCLSLCDPALALRAVRAAGTVQVPFRVALPTYGYIAAFDGQGRFLGLSAEGAFSAAPGVALREVRADPLVAARLLAAWNIDRPAAMAGVAWYRLPSDDDRLNWRWVTLSRLVRGHAPRGRLAVDAACGTPRLWEVAVVNSGDADAPTGVRVAANWSRGSCVAADAFHGFTWRFAATNRIEWSATAHVPPGALAPGERRAIGWLRLDDDAEVRTHVSPLE